MRYNLGAFKINIFSILVPILGPIASPTPKLWAHNQDELLKSNFFLVKSLLSKYKLAKIVIILIKLMPATLRTTSSWKNMASWWILLILLCLCSIEILNFADINKFFAINQSNQFLQHHFASCSFILLKFNKFTSFC